jgi:density-regulated protein
MSGNDTATNIDNELLPRHTVIYCGKCGMPPEYCEYGPDYETHCDPWLRKHHPDLWDILMTKRGIKPTPTVSSNKVKPQKPDQPWTIAERLMEFYKKYVPEKVETVPSLLEKYAGKEEKLFQALVQKYGPEPHDPYFTDSDDDDDDDDDDDGGENDDEGDNNDDVPTEGNVGTTTKAKKRRGAAANKDTDGGIFTGRVVVQKQAQRKKRSLTVVTGLEAALAITSQYKVKDVTKAFAKKFAGSSSEKNNSIIVQGDHVLELAEMLVDTFQVPEESVYVDLGDGQELPLRG